MSEEQLTQEEKDALEAPKSAVEDDAKDESDQEFINRINEQTGKSFKSVEAITKSLKQMDKEFAEQGKKAKKPETPSAQVDEEISEELLLVKNPEAETVIDDVRKIAKLNYGGNLAKAYREEKWLQEKAASEMQKEENIKNIKSPSSNVRSVEPSAKITDEDKRIADKYFGGDVSRYLKVKSN